MSVFRGCLNGVFRWKTNKKLIDYMIEKNIIYKSEQTFSFSGDGFDSTKDFIFPLYYNSTTYEINKDVLLDMYNILEDKIKTESVIYEELYDLVKKQEFGKVDVSEKIKALKNVYSEIMQKIDSIANYELYVKHIDKPTFDDEKTYLEQEIDCWKCYIIDQLSYTKYNFITYLVSHDFPLLTLDDKVLNEWSLYRACKLIFEYIENRILKLEGRNQKKKANSDFDNTTQKIILFNSILNSKDWNELTPNMKGKILSPLLGLHKDTIIESIDFLDPHKVNATKKSIKNDFDTVESFLKKLGVSLGDLRY